MDRWVDSFPVRQARCRPLAVFAIMVLVGEIIARRWTFPSEYCLAACAFVASLIAMTALRQRRTLALFMALGACLGLWRMSLAREGFPEVETRYSVVMEGVVDTDPYTNPDTGRVIMRFLPERVDGEESDLRLRLYLRGDEEPLTHIAYGQRLRVKGHIWANDSVTNPHEFDFGDYLHRNHMDAMATAKIEDVTILNEGTGPINWLIGLRHAVGRRIDALFPHSAAMVRALVLGDRSMIGEKLREGLNATGTAHLISISGLHVSVLALLLSTGLRLYLSRWRANLLTLPPLLFYGALIGFSPPFVRALTMFALAGFALWAGMPSDPVTRLCVALLGFLIFDPMAITDGGFVLSFSASAGIILLLPPLEALFCLDRLPSVSPKHSRWTRLRVRAMRYLPEMVCVSLAAQLATLPAVVALFGVQSVVSIPFNMVCVPLCMLGYLLALAVLILSAALYPLASLLARVPDGLLRLMVSVTQYSASLPLTSVRIGRYPALLILLHAAVILAASGLCVWPVNRRKFVPLALLAVAGLSSLWTWLGCVPFRVIFLDAGQADCAILHTGGHTYVFDAGDTYTPAADYLSATCLHVDGVFLSHPHQDHAGGLVDILECFKPDAIYVPEGWFEPEETSKAVLEGIEKAQTMGVPIVELSAGDAMPLSSDARLSVYNPDGAWSEVNDMSLLLLVEHEGRSVLFTGDLTAGGEPELIPDCDVLKVAHHGAENATSQRFLEAATPDIAVISVGENNHGHPAEMTMRRIADSGAEIVRTDECGAITLTHDGTGWQVETYLEAANEME